MWIAHRKEIRKLAFRALALRRSEMYNKMYSADPKLLQLTQR